MPSGIDAQVERTDELDFCSCDSRQQVMPERHTMERTRIHNWQRTAATLVIRISYKTVSFDDYGKAVHRSCHLCCFYAITTTDRLDDDALH